MSGHTPGPWFFGRMPDDSVKMILGGADRRYVAKVQIHQSPRHMGSYAEAEREANARLIAAAPDLLAACIAERLVGVYDNYPWSKDGRDAIKELVLLGYAEDGDLTPGEFASALRIAAIAKATGEA